MLARFTKLLGIAEKERLRFFSLSSLFFVLLISWSLANCARNAYFMKEAGPDKLPYMYMVNAVFMIIAASAYSRVVDRMARHRFLILCLIGTSALFLGLRALIPLRLAWMPYALYSLGEMASTILIMHIWTFANDIFDPREGKRIFPLVGAICSLAGVLGGFLAKPMVAVVGTANLFVIWSAALLATIPMTLWVYRIGVGSGALASSPSPGKKEEAPYGFRMNFSALWENPLIRTLTYIALPMWMIVYVIDFRYYVALDEVFKDQDKLAGFLGLFNSATSICGLGLQLFVTSRLLKRFGAGTTFLLYPITLTSGAVALALRSILPAPAAPKLSSPRALAGIYPKFSDNVVFYSTADPSSHLLYNALPADKRGQGRAFICGTVEPICTALTGAILILIKMTHTPDTLVSFAMVGCGTLLVILALRIKSAYLETLIENMGSDDVDLKIAAINLLSQMHDSKTTSLLLNSLTSANEESALFSLELLKAAKKDRLAGELCGILPKTRPKVKVAVVRALSEIGDADSVLALAPLLEDVDPEIRAATVRAISRLGTPSDKERLPPFLDDLSPDVRAETCIAVINADLGIKRNILAIDKLREMAQSPDLASQAKAAYVFGEVRFKQLLSTILNAAASTDELLQREAFGAIGKLGDAHTVPKLVRFLDVSRLTLQAEETLVNLGDFVLEPLHRELSSPDNGSETRINIVGCLKRLGRAESVPVLAEFLKGELTSESLERGIDALASIKTRLKNDPDGALKRRLTPDFFAVLSQCLDSLVRRIERDVACTHSLKDSSNETAAYLLKDALGHSIRRAEETALRCLELFSDPETIRSAASRIRTGEARTLAEAFEVLEGSCPQSRGLVRALEKKYFPDDSDGSRPDPGPALTYCLAPENAVWTRACAIFAIGELKIASFKEQLGGALKDQDPVLRGNAALALRKIEGAHGEYDREADTMAVNMQRVLFLRSVPLFLDVDGGDLQWISEISKERDVVPDETIFKENDEGDSLYIIISGSVRMVKGLAKPVILSLLQERDSFGEMAILEREKRSVSVEAQTHAKLLIIDRDDFQRLLLVRPKITFALLKSLTVQIRELQQEVLSAKSMADWFMKKSSGKALKQPVASAGENK